MTNSENGWNIAKSMSSLKNCLGLNDRTEDDMFSQDIYQPTTTNVVADLASGIKAKHAENIAKENHFAETYEPKDVI